MTGLIERVAEAIQAKCRERGFRECPAPLVHHVAAAAMEECAKIAEARAVKLRAKAKAQSMLSRQSYFAQAIEARVIADLIRGHQQLNQER